MKLLKKIERKIEKKIEDYYESMQPFLRKIEKFYLKIGINRLIEIRIAKTIFFYISFLSFVTFYFSICFRLIENIKINFLVPVIALLISIIFFILFLALQEQEEN
jgi:hypothetical protein